MYSIWQIFAFFLFPCYGTYLKIDKNEFSLFSNSTIKSLFKAAIILFKQII